MKYAYKKPEETVQVSRNRHDTSKTGTKNPNKGHEHKMTITSTIKNPEELSKSAY